MSLMQDQSLIGAASLDLSIRRPAARIHVSHVTPDFLIIGAMKCGTTTLAAQLGAQAGVFMTRPKEPFYFSDDDIYARGPDWYAQLFDAAGPGDLRGEASTHYTMLPRYPDTVARLKAAATAAGATPRFVYMIRNPVERAISHYLHDWIERRISVPLVRAMDEHAELIEYGRYGMQLEPFVAAFGPEAIQITSLEQMQAAPRQELARIGAHIGMTRPAIWQQDLAAQNVSATRSRKLPMHRLLVSHPVSVRLRRAVMPHWLDQRIRRARAPKARPEMPQALRAWIMALHRAECATLRQMQIPGAEAALDATLRGA